jgi:hypothetical protein
VACFVHVVSHVTFLEVQLTEIKSGLGINQKKCPHLILKKEKKYRPFHLLLRILHLLPRRTPLEPTGAGIVVYHIFGA